MILWPLHVEYFRSLVSSEISTKIWWDFSEIIFYLKDQSIIWISHYTWIIIDLGLADKAFPVGDIVRACWRSTWFSDSEFESFSSSLMQRIKFHLLTFKACICNLTYKTFKQARNLNFSNNGHAWKKMERKYNCSRNN